MLESELSVDTISYTQDGVQHGPYMVFQVVHMAQQGAIRADTLLIDSVTGERYTLLQFMQMHAPSSLTAGAISDITVPFWRAVWIILKWSIAAIPAGIALYLIS